MAKRKKKLTKRKSPLSKSLHREIDITLSGLSQATHLKLKEYDNPDHKPVLLFIDDESFGEDVEQDFFDLLHTHANSRYPHSLTLHSLNPGLHPEINPVQKVLDLQTDKLDAVILDLNMVSGSGIKILKELRAIDETKYLPVFIVTKSVEDEESSAIKSREFGAQRCFFAKSAEPRLLYDLVMELEPAKQHLMDQRWIDVIDNISKAVNERSGRPSNRKPSLQHIGNLLEEVLGVYCLIRIASDRKDSLELEYSGDKDMKMISNLHYDEVPLLKTLIQQQDPIMLIDTIQEVDFGPKLSRLKVVKECFLNTPAMFGRLESGGKLLGTISLYRQDKQLDTFRETDKAFFQNICFMLQGHLSDFEYSEELKDQQRDLLEFANGLAACESEDAVFEQLGKYLFQHFCSETTDRVSSCNIRVLSNSTGELSTVFHKGVENGYVREKISIDQYLSSSHAYAAMSREPQLRTDKNSEEPFLPDPNIASAITVPIIVRELLMGTINLESSEENEYQESDCVLVALFGTIAASMIMSLRAVRLEQDIVALVAELKSLTPEIIVDRILNTLSSFVQYRHLLVLRKDPENPTGFQLQRVAEQGGVKRKHEVVEWQNFLEVKWGNTLLAQALLSEESTIFEDYSEFVITKEGAQEIFKPYPDAPGVSQKTRSQLVIKLGNSVQDPKYVMVIMFAVREAINPHQNTLLESYARLISELLSQVELVEELHGDLYVKGRQAQIAEMYSQVSHTMRTVLGSAANALNAIKSEVVERKDEVNELTSYLSLARKELATMNQLVKVPEPKWCDLAECWNLQTQHLNSFALEQGKSIEIVEYDQGIECFTDPQIVQIIFFNLVQNAIEHIELDGAKIWLECKQCNQGVILLVKNTGSKVHPDMEGKMFKLGETSKTYSSGFGLYISKNRAEDLNAELDYDGTLNGVVTFSIKFKGSVNV